MDVEDSKKKIVNLDWVGKQVPSQLCLRVESRTADPSSNFVLRIFDVHRRCVRRNDRVYHLLILPDIALAYDPAFVIGVTTSLRSPTCE
jgi:hypothetical protein